EAYRLSAEDALRSFDLTEGPLLRAALVRFGEDDHAAILTLHHIVSDAWSMGVLIEELTALYPAALAGRPGATVLPELPFQYADFAAWQRQWLAGEELERQTAFWRQHLAGAPSVLELPADRPRPARASGRGQVCRVPLPPTLGIALATFAR